MLELEAIPNVRSPSCSGWCPSGQLVSVIVQEPGASGGRSPKNPPSNGYFFMASQDPRDLDLLDSLCSFHRGLEWYSIHCAKLSTPGRQLALQAKFILGCGA